MSLSQPDDHPAPLLPASLFAACPVQPIAVGAHVLKVSAAPDMDALLDFYARTQPANEHAIPYYAVLWDSALALSEHLAEHFGDLRGRRVLELGCGLGLPSILAAKCGGRVTATDFHPDCGAFLRRNAAQNDVALDFEPLDWARIPEAHPRYDLVLASDVIYHAVSMPHLVAAASGLCHAEGTILLADPGRDRLQAAVHAFREAGFAGELHAVREIFVFSLTSASARTAR